jgi:hypothetical protein
MRLKTNRLDGASPNSTQPPEDQQIFEGTKEQLASGFCLDTNARSGRSPTKILSVFVRSIRVLFSPTTGLRHKTVLVPYQLRLQHVVKHAAGNAREFLP